MFPKLIKHQPKEFAEIGELVRQAALSRQAIYPAGGQTKWDHCLPPTRDGSLLDTRKLDQVIDYPARDMTITVQAGMTVARLQRILAVEKQRLPIDIYNADQATIGGILATNTSGPRRYGYGTLRDYVIGISFVNDEGHEIKAGGRVVKNVAGYDFCKLHIGAFGTLGVISQVTLKIRPLAEEFALFALPCSSTELEAVLTRLHATQTRPVCFELLNPAATQALSNSLHEHWPAEWTLVVGFEDNADALKWQVQQLVREFDGGQGICGVLGACTAPLWGALVEFAGNREATLSFKAGMPSSKTAAFCYETDRLLYPVQLQAHAGNGIVIGHCMGDGVFEKISHVRQAAVAAGGHLMVTHCPAAWKNPEFVWGQPRRNAAMMRMVKDKLDPRGIFNPGRFVGGI